MSIAIDATSTGTATSTTITVAHTCAANATILWVGLLLLSGTAPTSVKYNNVTMTQLSSTSCDGTTDKIYLYYLVSPSSGNNNIVVANSGSVNTLVNGASYTGSSITGVPDNQVTVVNAIATSLTSTLNVATPNSWLVGMYRTDGGAWTVGANTTERVNGTGSGHASILCDTNAAQASGSRSMTMTCSSGNTAGLMASFAPIFIPADPGDTEVTSDSLLATVKPTTSDSSVTSDSLSAKITPSNTSKNNSTWINTARS